MKIAIIGYGKMGRAVEAEAKLRGHSVDVTIDNAGDWESKGGRLPDCDVAVEFSTPAVAKSNVERCMAMGIPTVCGTTGWYSDINQARELCLHYGGALLVSSNFSIGMNIVFELNKRLAEIMNRYPQYDVTIEETHHIHKLDAPSGTAITLARDILGSLDRKNTWKLDEGGRTDEESLSIVSHRVGEVPGIHEIRYDSDVDSITLTHNAKNRRGLAVGAVFAAEFLCGRKGFFTMKDLMA